MFDPTPPPYGDVTRRWTLLTAADRDRHTARLLTGACPHPDRTHVDRPGLDAGGCYRQLVHCGGRG